MKIGFVVYGDIETTSGGFLYDRKLIEGLRTRGDEVAVIELPWPSYRRGLVDGVSRRFGGNGLGGEFAFDPDAFDVLLEDELAHPTLLTLNARLRRVYDCPIVSLVHHLRCSEVHPRWAKRGYRAIERRYLRTTDAAICNSSFTEESVTDLADLPTTIAPPAGDRFEPTIDAATITERAHGGVLNVVFLASVIARKGLTSLIEALSRLPNERWRLDVVGDLEADPTYTGRVRRTISRLGLESRVSMQGALADDAVETRLRGSHLLAIPSTHEGFGIAYLEGMGFGLPALATTAGGARDIVTHDETGYLCSAGDVEGIARYMRTLADDRTRLAEMGVAARTRYETWPTWAESAATVGEFLDRVVAGNVRSRATRSDDSDADATHSLEEVYRALA